MTDIITVLDLPADIQSAEMVSTMVAGANARASRVAPCLVQTSAEWAATTVYAVDDKVLLSGGQSLQVTVEGTSGAAEPAAPSVLGETVTDGTVTWELIAPTLGQLAEAKLILIGAIKRWVDAGSGAFSQQTAGPFQVSNDTRQRTGYNLWPSEIESLQDICRDINASTGAFSIRPSGSGCDHLPWCSLMMGATYCSCGVDIACEPIFELD